MYSSFMSYLQRLYFEFEPADCIRLVADALLSSVRRVQLYRKNPFLDVLFKPFSPSVRKTSSKSAPMFNSTPNL